MKIYQFFVILFALLGGAAAADKLFSKRKKERFYLLAVRFWTRLWDYSTTLLVP